MFSMSIRPEILKNIREKYPPGTAVEVVEFHDQYRDIPAGTKGRVLAVDDTGTITASSRTVCRSEPSGESTS